jgi:hypothetical protein
MKPKKGFCINCDNRHGCKSQTPPCIIEMMENNVVDMLKRTKPAYARIVRSFVPAGRWKSIIG